MSLTPRSHLNGRPSRRAAFLSVVGLSAITACAFLAPTYHARTVSWLAKSLESRIPPARLNDEAPVDGIIVLGGGVGRVQAALELAQRFPNATLVLSGPGRAEIALAMDRLGKSGRLVIDRRATNTFENAVYSRDLLDPVPGQSWALVTSALHMPRAIGAFQAVGFPVHPWPVPDTLTNQQVLSDRVWHEVLGLIGYWALGRSAALYPRPSTSVRPTTPPSPHPQLATLRN